MKAIRHFHYGEFTPTFKERLVSHPFADKYYTAVIDNCPTNHNLVKALIACLTEQNFGIVLHVGVARLHPGDSYNKKTGVKVATEDSKTPRHFNISFWKGLEGDIFVDLHSIKKDDIVQTVQIKVNPENTYPEIIGVDFRKHNPKKGEKA